MTTITTLARDAHGLTMTGDASTVVLYDHVIDRLARFHPDVIDLATRLGTQAEPPPIANALIASPPLHKGPFRDRHEPRRIAWLGDISLDT